jgi:hypothetical protein
MKPLNPLIIYKSLKNCAKGIFFQQKCSLFPMGFCFNFQNTEVYQDLRSYFGRRQQRQKGF